MPQDEIEELNSSDSSIQDDAAQATATGEQAQSSGAEDEKDTLSIVQDVVQDRVEDDAASSAEVTSSEEETAERVEKEPDPENYSDVPFHTHPRFKQLIAERNSLRDSATRFQGIRAFLDENGVNDAEAADALQALALSKRDPAAAWEQIKPFVQKLLHDAGEILSPELQHQVDQGLLPREVAVQMNRQAAQMRSMQQRQTFEQQRFERRAQAQATEMLASAATAWEQDRKAKDPNYGAKEQAIQKEIVFLQRTQGVPRTPAEVTAMCEAAYKAVNASFRPPAPPAPRRQAARPTSTGGQTSNAAPAPKSTLDIIKQVAARR